MEYDEKMRDAVAREIKKAYTERKSRLLGRPWKPSSRHQSFSLWQAAADNALHLGAPPEAYVQAAFRNSKLVNGPFPNNLGGAAATRWWADYVKQNPKYREEQEMLEVLGIKDLMNMSPPAVTDIKEELQSVRQELYNMTGEKEWPPLGPKSLDIVQSTILPMSPHMRLILSYPDDTVRDWFGEEILEHFHNRPDVLRALNAFGYPMNEILSWLRQ